LIDAIRETIPLRTSFREVDPEAIVKAAIAGVVCVIPFDVPVLTVVWKVPSDVPSSEVNVTTPLLVAVAAEGFAASTPPDAVTMLFVPDTHREK
jgi:acyl-CoA reductase-like NAD-dependent aldehyde dehydrogenase